LSAVALAEVEALAEVDCACADTVDTITNASVRSAAMVPAILA